MGYVEKSKSFLKETAAKAEDKLNEYADDVQKKPKMGYIKGYEHENNLIDQFIASAIKGNTKDFLKENFDRNSDGEKIVSNIQAVSTSVMPNEDMQTFRTNIRNLEKNNNDYYYEDPTFLGFDIMIDKSSSPLFNYGVNNKTPQKNTAIRFLTQYQNIQEIESRQPILSEFENNLFKIFDFEFNDKGRNKTYYIEGILGLDKLNAKMTKDEDVITIKLVEDVSMRVLYLAELYNNLIYSYRNQRYLIPFNCLRFDMKIKISDVRIFKNPNTQFDTSKVSSPKNPISKINDTPSQIIFTLHDCNFDFSNSQIFDAGITTGGFNALDMSPRNLSFNIKYKSITRELTTPLIDKSKFLNNKNVTASYKKDDSFSADMFSDINSNTKLEDSYAFKSFQKKIGDKIISIAKDNVDDQVNSLSEKFRDVRGKMIDNMFNQLRAKVNVPKIYPDNVYSDEFEQSNISPEKFLKGLGVDLYNSGEDATKKELGGALGSFGL